MRALAVILLCLGTAAAAGERVRLQASLPRAGAYAKRVAGFAGGVVLAEAAGGALDGDLDAVKDALAAPADPEFLIGLLTFERAHHYSASALSKLPGFESKLAGAVKSNLALAAAMTVASSIEVDLGDAPGLGDAEVKLHDVEPAQLAVSLAAFSAALPVWARIKSVAQRFAGAVAKRFAKRAAVQAALVAAPVPGSRVAALGLLLWDLGAAAVDLGGMLVVAHAAESTAREALSGATRSYRELEAEAAVEAALGDTDPRRLRAALDEHEQLQQAARNAAYAGAAEADLALVQRLRRHGASSEVLSRVAQDALSDYGPGGALVAQGVYLDHAFAGTEHAPAVARSRAVHRTEVERALARRRALYQSQLQTLDRWRARARSPRLQRALEARRLELEAKLEAERDLVAPPAHAGFVQALDR